MRRRMLSEWPTLALLVATYGAWGASVFVLSALSLPLAIALASLATALHSSLTHEAVHSHPTDNPTLNHALVWPALGLLVPYGRFRDTHLAHHRDARLTDPYDDPESNYLDPAVWVRLPRAVQALLRANNTLLGRITLGPAIGQIGFMAADWRAARAGAPGVALAWVAHVPAAAFIVCAVALSPMPLWAYAIVVYVASALLRIRTFLEHRAHHHSAGRTVVIEDRGPLAFLFLNNNFHLVHHMHPGVPWFRLPALYDADAGRYLRRNQGYRYRSYAEIFARHLLRAKDPVPHPLWPQPEAEVVQHPPIGGAAALFPTSFPASPITPAVVPVAAATPKAPAHAPDVTLRNDAPPPP